jgi:D-glycero-D-manno-heptose 1,7-bisphosphate phosphatase
MNLAGVAHFILDRDGVLNVEAPGGGYIRSPDEWRWIEGALDALAMLESAGLRVTVATNQSGVGRGLMTIDDLAAVHAGMLADVTGAGGRIDAVLSCCHAPDEACDCRKPEPGLIRAAVEKSGIGPEATLVVGDDLRDIQAARAAGVPAALVLTGKGRSAAARLDTGMVPTFDSLYALATAIVSAGEREAR